MQKLIYVGWLLLSDVKQSINTTTHIDLNTFMTLYEADHNNSNLLNYRNFNMKALHINGT